MKNMIIALMVTAVLVSGTVVYGAPMTDRGAKARAKEKDKTEEQKKIAWAQRNYEDLVKERKHIEDSDRRAIEQLPGAEKAMQETKEDIASLKKRIADAEAELRDGEERIRSAEERTSEAMAKADAAAAKLSPKAK